MVGLQVSQVVEFHSLAEGEYSEIHCGWLALVEGGSEPILRSLVATHTDPLSQSRQNQLQRLSRGLKGRTTQRVTSRLRILISNWVARARRPLCNTWFTVQLTRSLNSNSNSHAH